MNFMSAAGGSTIWTTDSGTPPISPQCPTGANEIIVNAMLLDAPLQIHHNNDYGWWEIEEKTQLARKKGYNIWST